MIKTCEDLRNLYASDADKETKVMGSIAFLQHYLNTYKYSTCINGNGRVFAEDILYGLGVALDPLNNRYALGFEGFKNELMNHLNDYMNSTLEFNV
jgi:hypothetical protein